MTQHPSPHPYPVNLKPGCYVDSSAESADTLNKRTIEFANLYGFKGSIPAELPDNDLAELSEHLNEQADDAVDYLNSLETRSFISWQIEDNSLFLAVDIDSAREDCDFVSSRAQDYPPADYRGEWLHVSDHGNATLYVRDENGIDREVWGVV